MQKFIDFKFGEKRFVFKDGERPKTNAEQKKASDPIDLKLDALGLKREGDVNRSELNDSIIKSMAEKFSGNEPEIVIEGDFSLEALKQQVAAAIKDSFTSSFQNPEEVETIVDAASLVIATSINDRIFKPLVESGVELEKVQGLLKLEVKVDVESGLTIIPGFAGPLGELIEQIEKEGKSPVIDQSPEALSAVEQEEIDRFADYIYSSLNPPFMPNVVSKMIERHNTYYVAGLKGSFEDAAKGVLDFNFLRQGVGQAFLDEMSAGSSRPVYEEKVKGPLHEALLNKMMNDLKASVTEAGFDFDKLSAFHRRSDTDFDPGFKIEFKSGALVAVFPDGFKEKYDKSVKKIAEDPARNAAPGSKEAHIAIMKKGFIGMIAKIIFGVKTEEDWLAVESGSHSASFLYSWASYQSGGKGYPWMYDPASSFVDSLKKSERLAPFVDRAIAMTSGLGDIAEKSSDAVSKVKEFFGSSELLDKMRAAAGKYVVASEKGMELSGSLRAARHKIYKLVVSAGQKIDFPSTVKVKPEGKDALEDVKDISVAVGSDPKVLLLTEIPKGTNFSQGVEILEESA